MTLLQAILMGVIQGLTEFLPVSSSGHLALFKILFNVNTETGILFDILLHVATLGAVFAAFYKDMIKLIKEGFTFLYLLLYNFVVLLKNIGNRNNPSPYKKVLNNSYRRFVVLIIVATIPTGIIGIVGKDFVEKSSETLLVPGICLIITAILLFIADRCADGHVKAKDAKFLSAFEIGMVQGLATLPGLSRSGSTTTACLLCGFDRKFAVKFSFIMSVPAVLGAALLEFKNIGEISVGSMDVLSYIVGMIFAFVVGFICIKTVNIIVKKKKFTIFSVYCLAVGILCVVGNFLR